MRAFRKALAVVLTLITVLVVLVVFVIDSGDDIDYQDNSYIQDEIELYLTEISLDLREGERYGFVERLAPVDDWLLITVARNKIDAGEDTGTSGLLVIGQLQDDGWEFHLQGEEAFDAWLPLLPKKLLPPKLRDYFRSYPQKQSVSILPPSALTLTNSNLEEKFYLPYPEGSSFKISTLPGQSYHKGSIEHAIDFDMPAGTNLLSIASGTVMDFKDESKTGGCDKKYADDANFIRVKVAPDLAVLYLHLQADSIPKTLKTKGAEVEAGALVGKSGWSGFTCNWMGTGPGAHLHIVLEKLCAGKVCGSVRLNFEEFRSNDPRYDEDYKSANKSPEDRRAEQERKDIEQIKQVATKYAIIWSCGVEEGCDLDSHPNRILITGLFIEQIEKWVSQMGGEAKQAKPIKWEILTVELDDEITAMVEGKLFADVIMVDEKHHYEYLHIFIKLVKVKGEWRLDERIKRCGFLTDTEDNRLSTGAFGLPYCEY